MFDCSTYAGDPEEHIPVFLSIPWLALSQTWRDALGYGVLITGRFGGSWAPPESICGVGIWGCSWNYIYSGYSGVP